MRGFRKGITLVEVLVTMLILSIVFGSTAWLFATILSYWKIVDARTELQQKLNWTLQKISLELQESGFDSGGNLRASVLDNSGVNGTDILRFAVPICLCGQSPIDSNGDVRTWGAPTTWGQSGCHDPWPVENNNKVAICHVPPGNPNNTQDLSVNQNSVKAHLAHGDWIGACTGCDPDNYTNRLVEYSVDSSGRLIRKILDQNNLTVSQSVMTDDLMGYQAVLNTAQGMASIDMTFSRTLGARAITVNGSIDVLLRNRG